MRLTPTQRAAVVIELARRLGEGRPVSRADVVRDLYGAFTLAPARTDPDSVVTLAPPPAPLAPLFVEPPALDNGQDHDDVPPDAVVSFVEAAARLGLSVATVRRYAAPSSGKLVRLGAGVSLASVASMAA